MLQAARRHPRYRPSDHRLHADGALRPVSLAELRMKATDWHRRVLAAAGLLG